jgi:hypothetical protein
MGSIYWPGGDVEQSQAQLAYRAFPGAQPAQSYKPLPTQLSSVPDTRGITMLHFSTNMSSLLMYHMSWMTHLSGTK